MIASTDNPGPLYRAAVAAIEDVRRDIRIIRLRPEKPFSYKAGQYINLRFGGLPARPYSIASAPGSDLLEIHIKRGKGPASRYALEKLRQDEQVTFSGPEGDSCFDHRSQEPVIAIAGGLGIAPVKAIAEQALKQERPPPFTLYWGTYSEEERYLDEFFQNLARAHKNFGYRPVAQAPVGDIAVNATDDFSGFRVFVSGPPAMIRHLIPLLLEKGGERAKISYDNHPEAAKVPS